MLPSDAVRKMRAQHQDLRGLIDGLDTLLRNDWTLDALRRQASALSEGLRAHNQDEEDYIAPFLADLGRRGVLAENQMLAQHRVEHATLLHSIELPLHNTALDAAEVAEFRRALRDLRTHMEIEERRFLNEETLHDFIGRGPDGVGA